jgi:predicted outer membrane repeat protein
MAKIKLDGQKEKKLTETGTKIKLRVVTDLDEDMHDLTLVTHRPTDPNNYPDIRLVDIKRVVRDSAGNTTLQDAPIESMTPANGANTESYRREIKFNPPIPAQGAELLILITLDENIQYGDSITLSPSDKQGFTLVLENQAFDSGGALLASAATAVPPYFASGIGLTAPLRLAAQEKYLEPILRQFIAERGPDAIKLVVDIAKRVAGETAV